MKDKYYWLPRQLTTHIVTTNVNVDYFGFEEEHRRDIKVAFSNHDFLLTKCIKCDYYLEDKCRGHPIDIDNCMAGYKKPDLIQLSLLVPLTIWNFTVNNTLHFHNKVRLYNARFHKGEYYYKAYRLGNVGSAGNICWGKGGFIPKDLKEAYNLFWQKPFNDDLAPTQGDLTVDSLKQYNPDKQDPDIPSGINEELVGYPLKIDKDQPQILFKGIADLLFFGVESSTLRQFPESELVNIGEEQAIIGLMQLGREDVSFLYTKTLTWCKVGKPLGKAKYRLIGSTCNYSKINVYYK